MAKAPQGSNLGLGCGHPMAIASLKEGEVVLDLGSGAGFDAFLASNKVGKTGKIIGVDMTDEMLKKARQNAIKGSYPYVEFRKGDIENLPIQRLSNWPYFRGFNLKKEILKRAMVSEETRVLSK